MHKPLGKSLRNSTALRKFSWRNLDDQIQKMIWENDFQSSCQSQSDNFFKEFLAINRKRANNLLEK